MPEMKFCGHCGAQLWKKGRCSACWEEEPVKKETVKKIVDSAIDSASVISEVEIKTARLHDDYEQAANTLEAEYLTQLKRVYDMGCKKLAALSKTHKSRRDQ